MSCHNSPEGARAIAFAVKPAAFRLLGIRHCSYRRFVQSPVPMKPILFFFLTLSVLLINSCIDGEEEVFIRADGSAKMKVAYQLPGMFFSQKKADQLVGKVEKAVGEKENLRLLTNEVETTSKGQRIIRIEVEAVNMVELDGMFESDDEVGDDPSDSDIILDSLLGELNVDINGLAVGATRKVDLAALFDKFVGKNSLSQMGDAEFRYTVHLPEAANQSNAHQVLNGGKTLKWRYQLSQSKQNPIDMQVEAPIPLPWWLYVILAFAGFLLIALVWLLGRWLKVRLQG